MTDVLGYLASKNVPLRRADARNVHTTCFFCDEDPSSRGRLYICTDPDAETPGLFMCHLCQAKGSLTTIKRHFGDNPASDELDSQLRSEILATAAAFYQQRLSDFYEVFAYLRGPQRGLTTETIRSQQIGYAPMEYVQDVGEGTVSVRIPRGLYSHLRDAGYTSHDIVATGLCQERDGTLVDALRGMISIPYFVAGNVVAIRGRTWPHTPADFEQWEAPAYRAPEAKYKTCGGTTSRLFNTDACWNTDEVHIAEGEFDCLVLQQHGYPAIGVPGANSWQESWDDYLAPLKRVWLIFDRDAAGEKAAKKLTDRLGSKVRRVHLSEEGTKCDPTDWFQSHTTEEFDALVAASRKGGLLITVDEARTEFSAVQGTPGLKFAWELFDIMINPGIQPSQLMIVLAKTGGNKTLFLLNLMHRIRMVPGQENSKILFVSLEQTRGEWWDRIRRIHRFYHLDDDEETAADFWRNNIMLIDRNRISEIELRQAIDDFAYEMGGPPDVVCVDYLGYWARSFKGEAYARTTDAVMALKSIAKDYMVPVIAPHQVSRAGIDGQEFGADGARDSGAVEETADFLLTMWTPDNLLGREEEQKSGQFHLRIGKSRHGGRGVLLNLQFAPISLTMVPEGDPLCARARKEFGWSSQYRDTWEKAVYRHLTGFEGHLDGVPQRTREHPQIDTEWRY